MIRANATSSVTQRRRRRRCALRSWRAPDALRAGEAHVARLRKSCAKCFVLSPLPAFRIDYLEVVDAENLAALNHLAAACPCWRRVCERTRLIDNEVVKVPRSLLTLNTSLSGSGCSPA